MSKTQAEGLILRNGLPLASRQLDITSVNAEKRTIDVVWSTGAKVRRFDWDKWRYYDESLSMQPEHCDISRLNNGAPVLNTHFQESLAGQIGVVERAWLVGNEGHATLRISRREDVEPFWQDIADGIIRNISVGYIVRAFEITEREGQTPEYRAIDWQPTEISFVPVPADADAGTRSATRPDDAPTFPVQYRHAGESAPAVNAPASDAANPEQDTPQDTRQEPSMKPEELAAIKDAERKAAVEQERQRAHGVRHIARAYAHLGEDFVRSLTDDPNMTVEKARELVVDRQIEEQNKNPTRNQHMQTVVDETDVRRAAMQEALHSRAFAGAPVSDSARRYANKSMVDLARACVVAAGGNAAKIDELSRAEVVELALNNNRGYGMHTTSDFPVILANEANRAMLRGYELAGQTFRPLVRETSAPDFKEIARLRLGNQVELKEVKETGEFEVGNLNDAGKESYKLRTFGRIVNISRHVILNDDLGVFSDAAFGFGRSAANLESNLVWGLITGNAKLGDGKELFHAAHKNIAAPAALSVDTIDAVDQLIGAQTEPGTGDDLNLSGTYILVPRGLKLAAQKAIGFVSATETDKINPLAGQYQIITEARLTRANPKAWYVAASPNAAPTIELAYLEGQRGVYTTSREGFEVDGVQVKGRIDVGVGLMDHRWIARNVGV